MSLPSRFSTKRLPSSLGPLLALYVFCIVRFHLRDELQVQTFTPLNVAVLLSGFISLSAIALSVDLLVPAKNVLKFACSGLVVAGYVVLSTYHLRSHSPPDYAVLGDNMALAFRRESLRVIGQTPQRDDYILVAVSLTAVALLQWKWRPNAPPAKKGARLRLLALLAAYGACLQFLPYSYDELTCFAQSAYRYYVPAQPLFQVTDAREKFPYVREIANERKSEPPQNIFLIMIESFNANFAHQRTPEGQEYMPFFNELTRQGMFYDNFWGESMQTVKGQLSVLASITPLTRKKVFTDYPDLNLHCLPQVMKENGYDTVFFQGFADLNFENTGAFMRRNGFSEVEAMNDEFVSAEEKMLYKWGWGIQDNILYQKAFQYLDRLAKPGRAARKGPGYFVLLATISNHMKFRAVPAAQRYLYPQPRNRIETYANSIRVTDEYLKTFFEELQKRDYLGNSIVLITGDHSFPVGEHGYYDSESGFYNEYFKTPLLIWGRGISPGLSHELHCQLDIAPTVLDLAGISAKVHFRGKSVFSGASDFVPLVQPYAGTCLGIVSGRYKYVYRERGQEEYVFDLDNDPLEKTNIVKTIIGQPIYETFHAKVAETLRNDHLIMENRIWPGPQCMESKP
jgi:arylsulfatase A-like enzyme